MVRFAAHISLFSSSFCHAISWLSVFLLQPGDLVPAMTPDKFPSLGCARRTHRPGPIVSGSPNLVNESLKIVSESLKIVSGSLTILRGSLMTSVSCSDLDLLTCWLIRPRRWVTVFGMAMRVGAASPSRRSVARGKNVP